MGCASDFLEMLPNSKWPPEVNSKIFVGAKTLKLEVNMFIDGFFRVTIYNMGNYSNFTITFPMIWRWAGDFFKVLLKFKMATTDQL